jgi:hypothetical protein
LARANEFREYQSKCASHQSHEVEMKYVPLKWTYLDGGLAAAGNGRDYWLQATKALHRKTDKGDRNKPISLFEKRAGRVRYTFRGTYNSIGRAVAAAENDDGQTLLPT